MMNIPPSEVERMSLYDYEALLYNWNEAHGSDDVEAPDADRSEEMNARINADPRLTGSRELTGKTAASTLPTA